MSTVTYLACPARVAARPLGQAAREAFGRLLDQLLEQGRYSLRWLQQEASQSTSEVRALFQAGYLQTGDNGQVELTAAALRASEERMLGELFSATGGTLAGAHLRSGNAGSPQAGEEPRPHQPGEPLDHVDVPATLGVALARGLPLQLRSEDVTVRPGPAASRCVSVLLLDLSGSMARHGKFTLARRAALALRGMVRRAFPGDELITAGFASRAELLPGRALLEAMPRNVGLFDAREATHRVGIYETSIPQHFTNIQAGLRLARQELRRRGNVMRQVVLVTDGEPTAHLEGDELVLAYPPLQTTVDQTLREAALCAREGISLSIFGLVEAFSPPGLRSFVERLARVGRGTAVCCSPHQLGSGLLGVFQRTRSIPR